MERTTRPRPDEPQENRIVFHWRFNDESAFADDFSDLISRGFIRFAMRHDGKPGWVLTDLGRAALSKEID